MPTYKTFQSTLSVWRGTSRYSVADHKRRYFNPPSPCGEGLELYCKSGSESISIHPLRVERDRRGKFPRAERVTFQSTLSVWRGTAYACPLVNAKKISIHPLRVERDIIA